MYWQWGEQNCFCQIITSSVSDVWLSDYEWRWSKSVSSSQFAWSCHAALALYDNYWGLGPMFAVPENTVLITLRFTWYKQATSNRSRHNEPLLLEGGKAGCFHVLQVFRQIVECPITWIDFQIDCSFIYSWLSVCYWVNHIKPKAMLARGKVAHTVNSARVPAAWPQQQHDTEENDII